MTIKLTLSGQEVDLTSALPLRVADWRALEKHGVTMETFTNEGVRPSFEQMVQVAIRVLGRAGKDETFVDQLTLNELVTVFSAFGKKEADPAEVNRPT